MRGCRRSGAASCRRSRRSARPSSPASAIARAGRSRSRPHPGARSKCCTIGALGVADDGDLVAGGERAAHGAGSGRRRARRRPSGEVLEGDATRRPAAAARRAPSSSRPMRRRSACSSSATSTRTNGRSSSNPGRNDWRTTVHERTVPRPLTGTNANPGRCDRSAGNDIGRMRERAARAQRATASTWSAAASQNGADCSSGTGSGPSRRQRITPASLQRADVVPV